MKIRNIISSFIIFWVVVLVVTSVVNPGQFVVQSAPEPTFAPEPIIKETPCAPVVPQRGENKIALRISDVQAYGWSDTASYMLHDAVLRDIPVIVSVIPDKIEEDEKLVIYLKEQSCNITLAQQGTNPGETPEFKDLNSIEVEELALSGKQKLEAAFGLPINAFVPPQNWYNWQTAQGLSNAGYDSILVEGSYKSIRGVTTYDFYAQKLVSNDKVLNQCSAAFRSDQVCVIILYPSAYIREHYINYITLLDELTRLQNV